MKRNDALLKDFVKQVACIMILIIMTSGILYIGAFNGYATDQSNLNLESFDTVLVDDFELVEIYRYSFLQSYHYFLFEYGGYNLDINDFSLYYYDGTGIKVMIDSTTYETLLIRWTEGQENGWGTLDIKIGWVDESLDVGLYYLEITDGIRTISDIPFHVCETFIQMTEAGIPLGDEQVALKVDSWGEDSRYFEGAKVYFFNDPEMTQPATTIPATGVITNRYPPGQGYQLVVKMDLTGAPLIQDQVYYYQIEGGQHSVPFLNRIRTLASEEMVINDLYKWRYNQSRDDLISANYEIQINGYQLFDPAMLARVSITDLNWRTRLDISLDQVHKSGDYEGYFEYYEILLAKEVFEYNLSPGMNAGLQLETLSGESHNIGSLYVKYNFHEVHVVSADKFNTQPLVCLLLDDMTLDQVGRIQMVMYPYLHGEEGNILAEVDLVPEVMEETADGKIWVEVRPVLKEGYSLVGGLDYVVGVQDPDATYVLKRLIETKAHYYPDFNGNNHIEVADLEYLSQYYGVEDSFDQELSNLVDINEDGLVDLYDLMLVNKEMSNLSIRKIDPVQDADFVERYSTKKMILPSWLQDKKNYAYAETDIEALSKDVYFAHSAVQVMIDELIGSGISLQPEISPLDPIRVNSSNRINGTGAWERENDTEFKILADIEHHLEGVPSADGVIILYTELEPCPSCIGIIRQFKEIYPDIDIEVLYEIEN